MALELWETLKEAITAYTGLSPATFFTVIALSLAFYHMVSGLFGSSPSQNHQHPRSMEEIEPLPPPVQLGEITEDELKNYDGSDSKKPLLMAIKGQIYDVSQSRFCSILCLFFWILFLFSGFLFLLCWVKFYCWKILGFD